MLRRFTLSHALNGAVLIIGSVNLKRYIVTLEQSERNMLADLTRKGSHSWWKVFNALGLLICSEGQFNVRKTTSEIISGILQSRRKHYERKINGELEVYLVPLTYSKPPKGHSQ